MRVLARITLVSCAIAAGGCAGVLGIEDPTPDFGDDSGPKTLVSIAIGPAPLAMPLGVNQQLTAIGTFSDGSQGDITAQTEFSIQEGASISLTPAGLAKAVAQGPSTVTAKLGRINGGAVAMVGPAVADHLVFGLTDVRLAQQQTARLRTLAVFTDDTMKDVTADATYSSDMTAIAIAASSAPGQITTGSQSGTATITARLGTARAGTVRVTVTSKQCRPVINEFQTGGAASPDDEWVEILNPCTSAITVDNWTLVYRGAGSTSDSVLLVTLAGQLLPGEIKLFAGPAYGGASDGGWTSGALGGTNGGIALRMGARDVGTIADSVAYGTVAQGYLFTETAPVAAMSSSRSAQRLPFDGHDEDNGSTDFMQVTTPSPRAPNVP